MLSERFFGDGIATKTSFIRTGVPGDVDKPTIAPFVLSVPIFPYAAAWKDSSIAVQIFINFAQINMSLLCIICEFSFNQKNTINTTNTTNTMDTMDTKEKHPTNREHERTGTFIKVPQETQETHEHKTEHVKGETPIQIEVTKVKVKKIKKVKKVKKIKKKKKKKKASSRSLKQKLSSLAPAME